jgi:hypothetical protein
MEDMAASFAICCTTKTMHTGREVTEDSMIAQMVKIAPLLPEHVDNSLGAAIAHATAGGTTRRRR